MQRTWNRTGTVDLHAKAADISALHHNNKGDVSLLPTRGQPTFCCCWVGVCPLSSPRAAAVSNQGSKPCQMPSFCAECLRMAAHGSFLFFLPLSRSRNALPTRSHTCNLTGHFHSITFPIDSPSPPPSQLQPVSCTPPFAHSLHHDIDLAPCCCCPHNIGISPLNLIVRAGHGADRIP